jgi:hypothetical protein
MIKLSLLLLGLSLCAADYIKIGSKSYPVSSSSCPMGELNDFIRNDSLKILTMINVGNDYNYNTSALLLDNILIILRNMSNLYIVQNTSVSATSGATSHFITKSNALITSSLVGLITNKPLFVCIGFIVLAGAEEVVVEHTSESSASSHSSSVGHGEEGFTDDAHYVNANGAAISSRSILYGFLIRGVYLANHQYHDISEGCLIKNSTIYIQEQVNIAQAALTNLQSLNSSIISLNETMYNLANMFVNHATSTGSTLFCLLLVILSVCLHHLF